MLLKQALNALRQTKYPKISAATISAVRLIETASHTEHWANYKVHRARAKSPYHLGKDSQAWLKAQPHNHGYTNPTFMKEWPRHY